MDAAASFRSKPEAEALLLEHCLALGAQPQRPSAQVRLEALVGDELARRLVAALMPGGRR